MSLKIRFENHVGFYKKIIGISSIVFLAAIILVTVMLCWKKEVSRDFRELMDSLTYTFENAGNEVILLRDFGVPQNLSDREKAEYYAAQTRLYSIGFGNAQLAGNAYVNGMIYAQRCNANDIIGWITADFAQVLLNISAWKAAGDCIKSSLDSTAEIYMEEEYYAYCYSVLAFAYSSMDNLNSKVARQYYDKATSYSDHGFLEGYPADILNKVTYAQIMLHEKNYEECKTVLDDIEEFISGDNIGSILIQTDVSRIARYNLPYYKMQVILNLRLGNSAETLAAFETGYQVAESCAGYNMIMNFLADVIPDIMSLNTLDAGAEAAKQLEIYVREASIRYMGISEQMSVSTGQDMLSSSNSIVARVAQEHKVVSLYNVIISIMVGVVIIILLMTAVIFVVRHKGNLDGLTGAYNRRCFDRKYLSLCQKGKPFGVIMYDIDFFKQHNDTYGHAFGDEVLRGVSKSVTELLGHKKAELYRYGGDEFVVLWRKCNLQSLIELAQQTEDMVKALKWEVEASVSLSIGVAVSGQAAEPLKLADDNVYAAKEDGRGCVKAKMTEEFVAGFDK